MKRLLPVLLLLSLVLPSVAWAACSHSGTVWTCADTGNTTTNRTNAQSAITAAACGETINIAAGSVLVGQLTFNANAGCTTKTPVVVQSSAIFSLTKGVRVSPSSASNMAKIIVSAGVGAAPALSFSGARYYRVQGLEVTSAGGTNWAPILVDFVGAGSANDIVLDRMWIHPSESITDPTNPWRSAGRGIDNWGGVNLTVSNSYIDGFTGFQANSHSTFINSIAIGMPNDGAGPHLVVNNYLEAYWITFSSGGGGLACNGGCTTVSAATTPTTTQATLTSVTGLTVGALVTFQTSGGYQTGQVTNIAANLVTYSATPAVGWTCTGMTNAPTVGGTAQWAGNNVQNVTLQRNTFASLPLWSSQTGNWTGMNIDHRNVIFYTGVNVMVKGNTFLGDTYGPLGFFQSGSGKEPWAMVSNFTFRDNIINDIIGVGSSLSTHDTSCKWSGHDILVTNNLWRNIDPSLTPGNSGPFFWFYEANGPSGDIAYNTPLTAGHGKTYTHNTVRTNTGGLVASFNGTAQHMNVSDNVLLSGTYGFGFTTSVPANYPNLLVNSNVVRNTSGSALSGEFATSYVSSTVATDSFFGFTNLAAADAGGDYHGYVLTGGTSCTSGNWRLCASDGTDPGVNFPVMDAQLLGTCVQSTAMWRCSDLGDVYQNRVAVQAAFDAAVCGDTIILDAGMWIVGPTTSINGTFGPQGNPTITAPNTTNCAGNYITVQSSAVASLPATTRVTTTDVQYMATIATETAAPALSYASGAGWYKWIGIQFTNTENLGNAEVQGFTDILVASTDYLTNNVIYDRIIVRPYEEWALVSPDSVSVRSTSHGIGFDGATITVKNSWIGGFCCKQVNAPGGSAPTHYALLATGGLGPFTITNNFLEAYFSNIFTGGAGHGGLTLTTTTLSAATATTATLVGATTGLAVNDIIRLAAKPFININSLASNYIAAKVAGIAGQVVTFAVFGIDNGVDLNTGKCGTSGGDPSPPCVPTVAGEIAWKTDRTQVAMNGITATRNTFNKRAAWTSNSGQCKYFWEFKKGSNVLVEGNTFTGPVDTALGERCGFGFPIAIQQDGTDPWAESNHLIARSNLMPGVGQIYMNQPYQNHSMQPGLDILFTNNLLGGYNGTASAHFVVGCSTIAGSTTWTITHNTVRGRTGKGLIDIDPGCASVASVTFKDNIVTSGAYFGDVTKFTPNYVETKNVIVNTSGGGAPANTATDYVAGTTDAYVGFTNVASADAGGDYHGYRLTGTTACTSGNFRNCASDGTDPGVNFTTLDAALSGGAGTTSISGKVTIGGKAGVQ